MLAGYVARYFAPYLFDEIACAGRRRKGLSFGELAGSCREVHRAWGGRAYEGLLRHLTPQSVSLRPFRNLSASSRVYSRQFSRLNSGHPEALEKGPFADRLTNLLYFDFTTGILPMLLKFGDALSMAFSVESRLPFLDHRLVEFVFSLPAHHKLRGSQPKGILREAMVGLVPEQLLRRTDKVGFDTPVARWLGDCMDDGVRPLLLSKRCRERGIFDARRMERLLAQQARGEAHAEQSIFRWVSVELWFRLFIDGEGMPDRRLAAAAADLPGMKTGA